MPILWHSSPFALQRRERSRLEWLETREGAGGDRRQDLGNRTLSISTTGTGMPS